jgi:hypothetical protein
MALSSRRLPSLLRVPASPVPRSRRYYEGATTSHPLISGRSLVRSRSPPGSSRFVLAAALPEGWRPLPGPGFGVIGRPSFPTSLAWTRMGSLRSSGDPSCAFAPLQDPGRTDVPSPLAGTSVLPPLGGRRRLRQCLISGLTRSFGTRCRTLHAGVAAHVQGLLPAGRLAFAGRASNPLDRDERFQLVLTIIPLSCSPDATTLRFFISPPRE